MLKKAQNLLENYKKFDRLNNKNTLIKIFVSYIKPSFLFKTNILTPLHAGRAVAQKIPKDGSLSNSDLKWLYDNCKGDDGFYGNISRFNREIGLLTGTYYAFKNYEKLNNPEYFGSFGYRRLLDPNFLNVLKNYDLILPKITKFNTGTNKEILINSHGEELYNAANTIIEKIYGKKERQNFEKYLDLKEGYYLEIYVAKKEIFFEFCNWIFPILNEFIKISSEITIKKEEKRKIISYFSSLNKEYLCNENNFELYQQRKIGFAMERLTGYYLYNLKNKCNYLEAKLIEFKNSKNELFTTLRIKHLKSKPV